MWRGACNVVFFSTSTKWKVFGVFFIILMFYFYHFLFLSSFSSSVARDAERDVSRINATHENADRLASKICPHPTDEDLDVLDPTTAVSNF